MEFLSFIQPHIIVERIWKILLKQYNKYNQFLAEISNHKFIR